LCYGFINWWNFCNTLQIYVHVLVVCSLWKAYQSHSYFLSLFFFFGFFWLTTFLLLIYLRHRIETMWPWKVVYCIQNFVVAWYVLDLSLNTFIMLFFQPSFFWNLSFLSLELSNTSVIWLQRLILQGIHFWLYERLNWEILYLKDLSLSVVS